MLSSHNVVLCCLCHSSSNLSDVNSCDVNRDCVNESDDGPRRSNREIRTPDRFGE